MKTILTSFDFMQNFGFILTYKINKTDSWTPKTNVSTRFNMQMRFWKIFDFINFSAPYTHALFR